MRVLFSGTSGGKRIEMEKSFEGCGGKYSGDGGGDCGELERQGLEGRWVSELAQLGKFRRGRRGEDVE